MTKANFNSHQRELRERMHQRYFSLSLQTFLNLFFIICFSMVTLGVQIENKISLVIEKKGDEAQKILSDNFNIDPSNFTIKVNGEPSDCKKSCSFTNSPNNVIIEFNEQLTSCQKMFQEVPNIKEIDLSEFDASQVTEMNYMFDKCLDLKIVNFGSINTSSLKNIEGMFQFCKFLEFADLSNFDLSHIYTISFMFSGCERIKNISFGNTKTPPLSGMASVFKDCGALTSIDLSNFNTSNVTTMQQLFDGCRSLQQLDVSTFDTSKVESFYGTFSHCCEIRSLDLSNFNTSKLKNINWMLNDCINLVNLTLGDMDTSNVEEMFVAFQGCKALTSLDLSNWEFDKVTNIQSTFKDCINLENISFGDSTTPRLANVENMFQNCPKLTSIDLSNFDFTHVFSTYAMFLGCTGLQNVTFGNIRTPALKNMQVMFQNCLSITSIDLSKFDFSNVNNMQHTFLDCKNLNTINFGNINTSSLENVMGLFQNCFALPSMDLSDFDFSKVKYMEMMFKGCKNMRNITFGNKMTSSLETMKELFSGCSKLESINLSIFNTSKVLDMSSIFQGCSAIESIDISNLDTSKVTTMESMFNGCSNLINVNFGNIDTSSLENLHDFFKDCKKLESVDLSNLDTSKVKTMEGMFYYCSNFKYLNLSTLKTPSVENVKSMFQGCDSLIYLNLYSMILASTVNWEGIFYDLHDNVIYCIHDNTTRYYVLAPERYCFCDDQCFIINWTKIDFNNERCLDSCLKSNNKYEYKSVCYNKCPEGTLLKDFLCIDNFCLPNNNEGDNAEIPSDCVDGKPLGYFFDANDKIYKECYESCKTCNEQGNEMNHKCQTCKENFTFLNEFEKDKNCYPICQYNYYFDEDDKHHCTINENCPADYGILISQKKKCIDQCEKDNIYKYDYYHTCYDVLITTNLEETTYLEQTTHLEQTTNNVEEKKETTYLGDKKETTYIDTEANIEKETSDENGLFECSNDDNLINKCTIKNKTNNIGRNVIIQNLLTGFSSSNLQNLEFDGPDKSIYQVISSKKEKDLLKSNDLPDYYNYTIIDLGECEALLKEAYHIREEDSLLIMKIESLSNNNEKKIEYEVYEPYNNTKLNMSICSGVDINMYMKLELNEETKKLVEELEQLGYNIFDLFDPFYRDFCTPYKSPSSKTDVLLSDRIDSIYNHKDFQSQCQGNCKLSNYALNSKFINCTCHYSTEEEEILEDKVIDKYDAKTFMQSFYYVLKYSNYKILKCYKLVFVKTVFTKNKGAIIIFILFILYLMCLIWYMIQGIKPLRGSMSYILVDDDLKLSKRKSVVLFPPRKRKSTINFRESSKVLKSHFELDDDAHFENEPKKLNAKTPFKSKKKNKRKFKKRHTTKETFNSRINTFKPKKSNAMLVENKETTQDLKAEEEKQKKFDDFELNDLEYEEAVKYDHRSFFRVYFSLIKREHRIIFTFFVCRDYNLIPVKLSRFIFLLATDMVMNVFFFSDATMHKIFLSYGKYNFVQQIPQIIYSTILSQIIEVFLCFLSLTDTHMYEIKELKLNSKNKDEIIDAFKCMKKKLFYYFLITFIFFLGYWYIVAVFCAVYENTQIIFIKDCLMSSLLGFIYPLILYSFPASFRVCSLKCKNNKCLYKFSDIIPFF